MQDEQTGLMENLIFFENMSDVHAVLSKFMCAVICLFLKVFAPKGAHF